MRHFPSTIAREPRWGRTIGRLALVLGVLLIGTGCGARSDAPPRDGLGPQSARFTYGARSVVVQLEACGRDGDVVIAAGASGSVVLQVAGDLGDGGIDRSAVTGDVSGDAIFGAFGPDAPHGPAGEITSVDVKGDRLTIEGRWAQFDDEMAAKNVPLIDGRVVVRCAEGDEMAAMPATAR